MLLEVRNTARKRKISGVQCFSFNDCLLAFRRLRWVRKLRQPAVKREKLVLGYSLKDISGSHIKSKGVS